MSSGRGSVPDPKIKLIIQNSQEPLKAPCN